MFFYRNEEKKSNRILRYANINNTSKGRISMYASTDAPQIKCNGFLLSLQMCTVDDYSNKCHPPQLHASHFNLVLLSCQNFKM